MQDTKMEIAVAQPLTLRSVYVDFLACRIFEVYFFIIIPKGLFSDASHSRFDS